MIEPSLDLRASLDVQVLQTPADLEPIADEWEECYQADASATPYCSYDWIYSLAANRLVSEKVMRVCVIRHGLRAVAIVPLVLERKALRLPFCQWRLARVPYVRWAMDLSPERGWLRHT